MRRQTRSVAAAVVLLAAMASCTTPADQTGHATLIPSVATFTCCEAVDVDTVRHPGETFEIHWIMNLTPSPGTVTSTQVVLDTTLSSGYRTVEQLKSAEIKAPTALVRAASVITSDTATVAPVSVIAIPRTATPGLYNLTTSVNTDGAVSSGSSVIRIETP
jgi:hypothetical protein